MGSVVPTDSPASIAHPTVQQVADFAHKHLVGMIRSSGDSYFHHGLEVAATMEEITNDHALIAVAILHDLPSHPDGKKLLQQAPLDDEQRMLVRRMHALRHLHIDVNTKELDAVMDAFTDDGRLLLLRMAHRLNDVRHLDRFDKKRRKEIARETLQMYAAISGRLGFHRWRWQMEDICFAEVQPRIAKRMKEKYDACRVVDEACLQHARSYLQQKLEAAGIPSVIDERIKGIYSAYRKMVLKKRSFEELSDRLALRILVPTVEDCYRALGVIHSAMHPIHGKLKDYIGTPKENGYQSIHTVVYPLPGISEMPIEIQIRTHEMHRDCEYGIASHSNYKDWTYALTSPQARVSLMRNLDNLHSLAQSHTSFSQALRRSFDYDNLLIFDAQDKLYHISKPASAMDFACQAYPDDCKRITGVRINGRSQPLSAMLHDGDTVDVILGEKASMTSKELLQAAQQKATKELIRKVWKEA